MEQVHEAYAQKLRLLRDERLGKRITLSSGAAYHRGIWPDRYVKWVIVERDANLVGERVELLSGNRVGTVIDTANTPSGNVAALLGRQLLCPSQPALFASQAAQGHRGRYYDRVRRALTPDQR